MVKLALKFVIHHISEYLRRRQQHRLLTLGLLFLEHHFLRHLMNVTINRLICAFGHDLLLNLLVWLSMLLFTSINNMLVRLVNTFQNCVRMMFEE